VDVDDALAKPAGATADTARERDDISLRSALPKAVAAGLVLGAAIIGAAVVSRLNTHGIGLTKDSFTYLGMARTLADGDGYARPFATPGLPAETHFPPLYPTLLAVAHVLDVSVLRWASWINAAAFAAAIALVGAMVYDLSRSTLAAVLGAALTLTFVPLLDIYMRAWSEPTFLVWEVLALWMLARYNARGRRPDLVVAGIAAALGALTRYAGFSLVPAGLIILLLAWRRPIRRRLIDSAVYGVIGTVPLALWIVRNLHDAGTATDRNVGYRAIHSDRVHQAHVTVSGWIDLLRVSQAGLWWLAGVFVVAIVVGAIWYRQFDGFRHDAAWGFAAAVAYVIVYCGFLWASVAFADPNVHLTDRILSPLLMGLILSIVMGCQLSWSGSPARYVVPGLLAAAAVAVVLHAGRLERNAVHAATSHRDPFYVRWRASPLIRKVEALPPGTTIYSNLPGPIFVVTGRHAIGIPDPRLAHGAGANSKYDAQLAELKQDLQQDHGVVVELTGNLSRYLASKGHWPSPSELTGPLGLAITDSSGNDAILRSQ
jgi:hypothetical protein